MIISLVSASVIAAVPLYASAAVQPKPVFVQIIVKACRPAETPLEPSSAVGGWECIFTDHQVVGAAYQ